MEKIIYKNLNKKKSALLFALNIFVVFLYIGGCELYGQNQFPEAIGSFAGTAAWERLGYALSPAGDVNGDGYDDFLIGTFHYNQMGWDRGAVHLILGGPANTFGFDIRADQADARFLGKHEFRSLGYEVHAGDVNGSGYSDLLLGAPAGHSSAVVPGYAYMVFGRPNIDWGVNAVIDNVADVTFVGEHNYALAGMSVSVIGDMNGNGCAEILISAPYFDTPGGGHDNNNGRVYFFKGRSDGWDSSMNTGDADAIFTLDENQAFLGYSVSGIGDINGDGIPDFAMSATGINCVFVFFGKEEMDWGKNHSVWNADVLIETDYKTKMFGWMIRGVGDINNDGFDDFMFSDFRYDNNRGIAYLMYGQPVFSNRINARNVPSFLGENWHDHAGYRFSGLGDFNLNGYDDIILSAFAYSSPYLRNGKVYLIPGKAEKYQGETRLSTIADYRVGQDPDSMHFGNNVSGVGDINGDGTPDFAVAAPFSDVGGQLNAGRVFVYHGEALARIEGVCKHYKRGEGVPDVQMHIEGHDTTVLTNDQGFYRYNINKSHAFQVRPIRAKYNSSHNGAISAYDAALTARHCVGLETLSGYSFLAADADENGSVAMNDASWIARFVVGLSNEETVKAAEWRFDPEYRSYSNTSHYGDEENYMGYIIGDVNGDWVPQAGQEKIIGTFLPVKTGGTVFNDTLIVPLSPGTADTVFSADLWVQYESDHLEIMEIAKSEAFETFQMVVNTEVENEIRIALFGAEPVRLDNPPVELKFRINNEQDRFDFQWLRCQINDMPLIGDNWQVFTSVEHDDSIGPMTFRLKGNYPNPFNPGTTIYYELQEAVEISLAIFDIRGRQVRQLVEQRQMAGSHEIRWDGTNASGQSVPSGIYLCRLQSGPETVAIKLIKNK